MDISHRSSKLFGGDIPWGKKRAAGGNRYSKLGHVVDAGLTDMIGHTTWGQGGEEQNTPKVESSNCPSCGLPKKPVNAKTRIGYAGTFA